MASMNEYIGARIRAIRNKAGLSQVTVAEATGLSRISIINIEKGRQSFGPERLYMFCVVLGCDYSEILPPIKKGS